LGIACVREHVRGGAQRQRERRSKTRVKGESFESLQRNQPIWQNYKNTGEPCQKSEKKKARGEQALDKLLRGLNGRGSAPVRLIGLRERGTGKKPICRIKKILWWSRGDQKLGRSSLLKERTRSE